MREGDKGASGADEQIEGSNATVAVRLIGGEYADAGKLDEAEDEADKAVDDESVPVTSINR